MTIWAMFFQGFVGSKRVQHVDARLILPSCRDPSLLVFQLKRNLCRSSGCSRNWRKALYSYITVLLLDDDYVYICMYVCVYIYIYAHIYICTHEYGHHQHRRISCRFANKINLDFPRKGHWADVEIWEAYALTHRQSHAPPTKTSEKQLAPQQIRKLVYNWAIRWR